MTENEDAIATAILFVIACLVGGFLFHIGWNVLGLVWRAAV